MPVLVEGDKGPPRRKKFAPKTRTGCVICKERRIKCSEEKPSCHRCITSKLRCRYNVPKTWLFDPNIDATLEASGPTSLKIRTKGKDDQFIHTRRRDSPVISTTRTPILNCWAGLPLFNHQQEYDAFHFWVRFLVRQIEPRTKMPKHVQPFDKDIWSVVVPQIACHSVALRNAMCACGTLLLSFHRKEFENDYTRSVAEVMRYSTAAVYDLGTQVKPLIETVLTAYTFWSLDLMACNLQSAMLHLSSVLKISQQCRRELASDELAAKFVHCMVSFIPGEEETATMPELDTSPPEIREAKAVRKLQAEYERVTTYAPRIALCDSSQRHDLLALIEESRREIQWLLSVYASPKAYAHWLLHRSSDDNSPPSLATEHPELENGQPEIFHQFLWRLDPYLTPTSGPKLATAQPTIPIEDWRKDAAEEILLLSVMTAQTDLRLRHIGMDFMEVSREIRWPGR